MNRPLLLLRPQPGNDQSAERARALDLEVIQLPLFEIVPVAPAPLPAGPFDALFVTSANGARHGAAALRRFADLPLFTVGEATADAIRSQGERAITVGGGDAASTIPLIVAAGHRRLLHICGADVRPFDPLGLSITRHIVYRSEPRDTQAFAPLLAALPPCVIAVHSPRAGHHIAALLPAVPRPHRLAAISRAAADAAGPGWQQVAVASAPDDTALLRLASALCKSAS